MENRSKISISISYFIVFGLPCIVFILPVDILDRCKICLNFTNFMKEYFVSISIFEKSSNIPQVTAFYSAFMMVWGVLFGLIIILLKIIKPKVKNISLVIILLLFFLHFLYTYYNGYLAKDITTNGWTGRMISKPLNMGDRSVMLFYLMIINLAAISINIGLLAYIIKYYFYKIFNKITRNKQWKMIFAKNQTKFIITFLIA
mgnify:CR=1 FL=1